MPGTEERALLGLSVLVEGSIYAVGRRTTFFHLQPFWEMKIRERSFQTPSSLPHGILYQSFSHGLGGNWNMLGETQFDTPPVLANGLGLESCGRRWCHSRDSLLLSPAQPWKRGISLPFLVLISGSVGC